MIKLRTTWSIFQWMVSAIGSFEKKTCTKEEPGKSNRSYSISSFITDEDGKASIESALIESVPIAGIFFHLFILILDRLWVKIKLFLLSEKLYHSIYFVLNLCFCVHLFKNFVQKKEKKNKKNMSFCFIFVHYKNMLFL